MRIPLNALRVLCALPLLASLSMLRAQTVVYVNAAAPVEGDGTSWSTPHKYLAPALANAAAKADAGQTVQVWIAAGTYITDQSPANPAGGTDDYASFTLHNSVSLYGGFDGTETALSQRDPVANRVHLTGFVRGGVYGSFTVLRGSPVDSSVVIDGLTITNPRTSGGGGKCIRVGGSASFRRCAILDTLSQGGDGAAVICGGRPVFEDCEFRGNTNRDPPDKAGAIFAPGSAIQLIRCIFEDNESEGSGGAIYGGGPGAIIEDCVFINNASVDASSGALYALPGTTVRRCLFTRNHAVINGALGGFGLLEDSVFIDNWAFQRCGAAGGSGTYVNCLFVSNWAPIGGTLDSGTAIGCTFVANGASSAGVMTGNPISIGCGFFGNWANNANVVVASGGGTFVNCIFSKNGGGYTTAPILSAGNHEHDLTVINCTFSGHSGPEIRVVGAARTATVRNSIFFKIAGAPSEESVHVRTIDGAAVSIHNSFFQVLQAAYSGNGNIGGFPFMSPRFIDPDGPDNIPGTEDDDLRLLRGSPCIDAGNSAALPPDILTDLAGNPRFVDDPGMPDAGSLTPPVVDMGAYEFQGRSCLADVNGDTFVDGADSEQFNNLFAVADPATDLNRDGFVDGIDADLFHNAFEAGC